MNNMITQIFNYEETELKAHIDDNGNPWFILNDVCKILGIKSQNDAFELLDNDVKGSVSIETNGGRQKINIVNEAGLYEVIFNSRKPKAKEFKRWICRDVLPSIRKTGQYSIKPQTKLEIAEQLVESLKENAKINQINKLFQIENKKLSIKSDFAESALIEDADVPIGIFATTNNLLPIKLFEWFRAKGILKTGHNKYDKSHNTPYSQWRHYFRCIQQTYDKPDDKQDYSIKTLVIHARQPELLRYIRNNAPNLVYKNKPKELSK